MRTSTYGQDFRAWTQAQAAALRAARPNRFDWEHIAEELKALGWSERDQVERPHPVDPARSAQMAVPTLAALAQLPQHVWVQRRDLAKLLRRNPSLVIGIVLLMSLVLFSAIGALTYDTSRARPLSVLPEMPPSLAYPFGSDSQGRDLFAVMVLGTPLTLRIGLLAGIIGVGVGTVLAFIAAYYGGVIDALIRSAGKPP